MSIFFYTYQRAYSTDDHRQVLPEKIRLELEASVALPLAQAHLKAALPSEV